MVTSSSSEASRASTKPQNWRQQRRRYMTMVFIAVTTCYLMELAVHSGNWRHSLYTLHSYLLIYTTKTLKAGFVILRNKRFMRWNDETSLIDDVIVLAVLTRTIECACTRKSTSISFVINGLKRRSVVRGQWRNDVIVWRFNIALTQNW